VNDALRRLDREHEAEVRRRLETARRLVADFNALPVVGPLLTDADIYDEDGLPK
jgi:hypothetical protein